MKNNAIPMGVGTRIIYCAMAIMTIILSMGENTMAQTKSTAGVKNIDSHPLAGCGKMDDVT